MAETTAPGIAALRRSPLHEHLKARGAVFGEAAGWERANWFAAPGETVETRYGFGRQNWHAAVGREMAAARGAASVSAFDLCSKAVRFARANAVASGVDVDVHLGHWSRAAEFRPFDLDARGDGRLRVRVRRAMNVFFW